MVPCGRKGGPMLTRACGNSLCALLWRCDADQRGRPEGPHVRACEEEPLCALPCGRLKTPLARRHRSQRRLTSLRVGVATGGPLPSACSWRPPPNLPSLQAPCWRVCSRHQQALTCSCDSVPVLPSTHTISLHASPQRQHRQAPTTKPSPDPDATLRTTPPHEPLFTIRPRRQVLHHDPLLTCSCATCSWCLALVAAVSSVNLRLRMASSCLPALAIASCSSEICGRGTHVRSHRRGAMVNGSARRRLAFVLPGQVRSGGALPGLLPAQ